MKLLTIEDIGEVQLQKHARAHSLRITIGADGTVKVTIPKWMPYQAGVIFVQTKKDWILANRKVASLIKNGQPIGKFHHLYFKPSESNTTVTTRQKGSELIVSYPSHYDYANKKVQQAARKISIRALRNQAENLLPKRLAALSEKHDFEYSAVSVRQLKARWGSCNSKQEITLNLFLMQLPWDLIDYVLLHELAHTQALHHGPNFWHIFEAALPGAKQKRKALREFQPTF